MPWNSGVYTRGYASWVTDANNSLPISATKFDTEDNDFAAGLNNCLTVDGLNKPTGTLNWSQQINWSRATDGNLWSLARTGGTNNPKIQGSVTDASGVLFTVTGGNLQFNAPALTAQGPVAGAQVDMTPDKGSWTTTLSGIFASNPTGTLKWERQGTQVTIWADAAITANTNANGFISASGLPAAITPSSNRIVPCAGFTLTLSPYSGLVTVNTGGTMTLALLATVTGTNPVQILGNGNFLTANTCGISAGFSITYSL
jgi:hypothetical protein